MKKKIIFLFFLLYGCSTLLSQAQRGSFGLHINLNEYDGDLNGNQHHFYDLKFRQMGGSVSLQQYLNPSFNLVEKFSLNQVRYQSTSKTEGVDANILALNLKLKYKFNNGYIFKETASIAPFLVGGIGETYIDSWQHKEQSSVVIAHGLWKVNMVAGVGILFQFDEQLGLEVSNSINVPLYDAWDGVSNGGNDAYLQHSVGVIFGFNKPKDRDHDE
jgi:OmpA-OmpF porin, OOP family